MASDYTIHLTSAEQNYLNNLFALLWNAHQPLLNDVLALRRRGEPSKQEVFNVIAEKVAKASYQGCSTCTGNRRFGHDDGCIIGELEQHLAQMTRERDAAHEQALLYQHANEQINLATREMAASSVRLIDALAVLREIDECADEPADSERVRDAYRRVRVYLKQQG